ncbi:MAG TPA: hypothetical protein PK156_42705 [Polyangium sp.]|nr:hypothetical protein [Polyangium sp.]
MARNSTKTNVNGLGSTAPSFAALGLLMGFSACVQIAGIDEPILGSPTATNGGAGMGGAIAVGGNGGGDTSSNTGGFGGNGGTGGAMACTPNTSTTCYSGPPGTEGLGICKPGTQTCSPDGSGYGKCMGEVLPVAEDCSTPGDENCDGIAQTGSACLVNTNLVVRYFLDEAMGGQPTKALDSAPAPLDLPVTFSVQQPIYVSTPSGRGLEWLTADSGGVARVAINGTKVFSMLNGNTKGTIELVARMDSSTGNYTRVLSIGSGTNNAFGIGVSGGVCSVMFNGVDVGQWPANFASWGRAVFHVVMDTTQATATNRVQLYVNGTLQTSTGGTAPGMNAAISITPMYSLCLGNRDTEGRSFDGVLYYAALYADALPAADIAKNVATLSIFDDK